MKLTVFQSDKGDCLLLTSAKGANILADGGMSTAYRQFVAPAMGRLRQQGKRLDLVYVSHIDEDHIAGILELLDSLVAWRVYDYQQKQGNKKYPKPRLLRPPEIGGIWHNAFSSMVPKKAVSIDQLLAQSTELFSFATAPAFAPIAAEFGNLAQSVKQAILVSQRIAGNQLKIPLNAAFGGRLAMVRSPASPEATFGGLKISVIGPFADDLDVLRTDWNEWVRDNQPTVKKLLDKAKKDAQEMGVGQAAAALSSTLVTAIKVLGDRNNVTPPNLASLMLLVEEGKKTVLLTGDGHSDDILEGLDHHGRFDGSNRLHVSVLKVQHHGSENNIKKDFCERVTADDYVFCGNGRDENPDIDVVNLIANTRLADPASKSFRFWFNSSSTVAPTGAPRTHMKKVEATAAKLMTASGGKLKVQFLRAPSIALTV